MGGLTVAPAVWSPLLAFTAEPRATVVIIGVLATVGGLLTALIAHRRSAQAKHVLERAAHHDLLTDLPNRSVARARMQELLPTTPFGLLVLELDRFAEVNESYGHEVGDRLLRSMAEQLEGAVGPTETPARWGGPQFAVIVPHLATSDQVAAHGTALQEPLNAKVRIAHDTLRLTASFGGVAADHERFSTVDEVVDAAITALEIARADGRGSSRTFDRTMIMPVTTTTAADRLRQALDEGELWTLWAPVVAMADRRIVGVEAVTHWADPQRGVLPPDEFADLLQRAGLESIVAAHALDEAIDQATRWHERWPELVVMVPTPPTLLREDDLVARLEGRLRATGADPGEICLQVAGQSRHDIYELWGTMRRIKDLGFQVALDDFGTGWSSLAYLRRFNVDVLKIPHEFIDATQASATDEALTYQIIGLAKALDLVAIAEGVTEPSQAELLVSLGCELGQGPLYGETMTLDTFQAALERGKVDRQPAPSAGIDWTATSS